MPSFLTTSLREELRIVHCDDELQRILTLACDHLGMEVAFVAELTETQQVFRAVAGAVEAFDLVVGRGQDRTGTCCDLLLRGLLPRVVPDMRRHPHAGPPPTGADLVGAYVGVPLCLPDGRLYGTFCCVSRTADPTLDARDAKFMDLLAAMVVGRVEAIETARQQHADVRHVLGAQAIDIALQPIVSLTSGEWRGVEALSRFPGSGRGTEEMFTLAGAAGHGPDLELLALRLALATLPELPDDVYLSVNMSPGGIADPRFAATMAECPRLSSIVLEVTEHAPVERYTALVASLAPMRKAGMRLAVDDVGAGYASFRHVLQLHPDIIKIDRSLVDGIAHDAALRSIAGNLVLLGLDLRASVVAEGVEHEDDLEVLETIGADMAQGYLFARPSTDPEVWRSWRAGRLQPHRSARSVTLPSEPSRRVS